MKERLRAVEGTITIDSNPGSGTKVVVNVPFEAPRKIRPIHLMAHVVP
jgi:signal transduction histidine kinase